MKQIWALHDSAPDRFPMQLIDIKHASELNTKGYGIFETINEFNGSRKVDNLSKIIAWAVDIDESSKEVQLERIKKGLIPSLVVETKRGFHLHWLAVDATIENWKSIVKDRLVPFYGADPKACDLARILRKPGFYHMKDPLSPFMVKEVWKWKVAYTEKQMLTFYASSKSPKEAPKWKKSMTEKDESFWNHIYRMDCEEALSKISGNSFVNGETYTFRKNHSGTKNIFVDGKSTSCWIDRDGKIGSLDRGGPSIYQWVNWFHKNPTKVINFLKNEFPELRDLK
ncbi:MAG: hypothetical protein NW224_26880 [Leptolyngbyaceae cyanobacterium bins.302]|nr:hypothetical protein [Leptolyngbyaceae cyanobacterium bins.302]